MNHPAVITKKNCRNISLTFYLFCFSRNELYPPIVSASSPLIDPLLSRINTISVSPFFIMPPYSLRISGLVVYGFMIRKIWSHRVAFLAKSLLMNGIPKNCFLNFLYGLLLNIGGQRPYTGAKHSSP